MYVIPCVQKNFDNADNYNVGDTIEYSNNGVDRWVVVEKAEWDSSLLELIPESPIELEIESEDDNITQKARQILQEFNNDVRGYYFYLDKFGIYTLIDLIPNFLNRQNEKIWFFRDNCYSNWNNKISFSCGGIPYYENGVFKDDGSSGTIYTNPGSKTLGYRPVVTLKISKLKEEIIDEKEKKEISGNLQVGDYVKYEVKGYKNWKVLSIDKDLGTVDIISGGIVKNLTLSGKEDWDNYEDIIQREVDDYKSGDQAKKATTVTSKDIKTLKEIDKSILSTYWILSKNSYIYNTIPYNGKNSELILYHIGTINLYKNDNFEMYLNNITIYADLKGDQDVVNHYKNNSNGIYINGILMNDVNLSSYTAGLRPVITLKLDSVKKLPEEETKKIEASTEKQEKVFIQEQETKNKDYKGPSKVDDSTSSTGNNNEVKSNDKDNTKKDNITDNNTSNVEKIVYKDKPFYKYGFIIFLITSIIELIIIMLLLKKIKR